MTDLRAIHVRARPVHGSVRPPGSKSLTNRALVVSALARPGVSHLEGSLDAEDTVAMRQGLRSLGALIDDVDQTWLVTGTGGVLTGGTVDAGASGTTSRFLTAVAALAAEPVNLDGSDRLRERPIHPLVAALRSLGAQVSDNRLPLTVNGAGMTGGEVAIDGSLSSQYLSALLMIAPMLPSGLRIRPVGIQTSRSYIAGTLEVMRAFGAEVEDVDGAFHVASTGYRPTTYEIEPDASAAVYPLIAAAITGGVVTIPGINRSSTQPDLRLLDVLVSMGCNVRRDDSGIVLEGPSGTLRATDVDMSTAPDASLALAVACLFADGPSRISGLGTLRSKETDRLAALSVEIGRLGATTDIDGDSLIIHPGALTGATIETYNDHRIAMSFAIAGLKVANVVIQDPGCVAKTWPGFFEVLDRL